MRTLGQLLSWAALWIAVTVTLLAAAAYLTGSVVSWVGVATFLIVSIALWLSGRGALFVGKRFGRRRC